MSSDSSTASCSGHLGRPPEAAAPIQHRIDELVSLGGAKAARERHCLAHGNAERHLGTLLQFETADQQRGVLDRIQFRGFAIQQRGKRCIELDVLCHDAAQESLQVLRIGALRLRLGGKFLYQLLPLAAIELPAVQGLQGYATRGRAGVRLGARVASRTRLRHAQANRRSSAAIASALSSASAPLFSGPGAQRSSACARVSTVSTPKLTGTPVSSITRCRPCAHSPATYWKCAVSPRITQPSAT